MQQKSLNISSLNVVNLLNNISTDTKHSIDILEKIENVISKECLSIFNNINSTINNIYSLLSKNFNELNRNSDKGFLKNIIQKIYDENTKVINNTNKLLKNTFSNNNVNETLFSDQILTNIQHSIEHGNSLLQDILENLLIFFKNRDDKENVFSKDKNINNTKKENKTELTGLVFELDKLKKIINKPFNNNFSLFIDNYIRFIDEKNTKKLLLVKVALSSFATILRIVAFLMSGVKDIFYSLSLSIWILGFSLISPPFQLGTIYLIAFITALKNTLGGAKGSINVSNSFKVLSLSVIAFVVSLWAVSKVKWSDVYKLLFFLTGLAGVLRLFDKTGSPTISRNITSKKSFSVSGLFGLSAGLALLILSIDMIDKIDFETAGALITFIFGLGTTIAILNKLNPSGTSPMSDMLSLGIGISLIITAIGLGATINWSITKNLLIFIAGLGTTIAFTNILINKFGGNSPKKIPGIKANMGFSGIFGFAMGLAVLILTLAALKEINWMPTKSLLLFIVGLGLALSVPGLIGKKGRSPSGIFGLSIGIAILVLTLDAIKEISWQPALYLLSFITAIGLIMKFMNPKGFISMVMFGASLFIIILALEHVSKTNLNIINLSYFVGTILILSALMYGISLLFLPIMLGVTTLILLGAGALLCAIALKTIGSLKYDILSISLFLLTIVVIASVFSFLSILLPLALIGVGLALTLGLSLLLVALPLLLIQNLTFENTSSFLLMIVAITTGLVLLTPQLLIAVVNAALLGVIGLSLIFIAGSLMVIAELEIDKKHIDNFVISIQSLINGIDKFGLVQLGKVVLKSVELSAIMLFAAFAAVTFSVIDELKIKPATISSFGNVLNIFIQTTTNAISSSVDAIKKTETGLKALSKLINVSSQLVDIISAFANMNYNQYEVKDGKLVLVGVKKISDNEIAQVGVNIGKLLQGLIQPLTIISGNEDYWDFGNGVKVKNPFKASGGVKGFFGIDDNSGAKRIEAIGNAFKPLVESVQNFSNISIAQDPKALQLFNSGLNSIIIGYTNAMTQLESWKNNNAKKSIKNISDLTEIFKNIDENVFGKISTSLDNMFNSLTDDSKWSKISQNLKILADEFENVSSSINSIDLKKALALENNLKLMTMSDTKNKLVEVIEHLKIMIGLLIDTQKNNIPNNSNENKEQNSFNQIQPIINTNKNDIQNLDLSTLEILLQQINDNINSTNNKLNGKLKVIVSGDNNFVIK